ncbi:hypothetical protein K32_03610 [Kaistia sp. 32K]|uniref:DUF4062 domain-containing protein n=1 Tax=Kaistia sp. 32K TaxID=2795690 RepID=UPI0019365348|nr:DUF4062 domain-containing protein [Kaistia sp. 32K]BCP51744.1 hypothetical protein K32_03610 [Kaistia sp. 32K]
MQDTVIKAGDFPVQMESFPASDETAFALIKSLLDKCDYYVLIIGGRYGSVAEDGLSYTHKEFRYAVSQNIPVLVMLHGARGQISADKTEPTLEGKQLLEAFITEASGGRTRSQWTSSGELQATVLAALVNAKQTRPRVGWVRGDAIASVDALEQLNEVRKENAKFRDTIGNLEVDIPIIKLPEITATIDIDFLPNQPRSGRGRRGSGGTIRTTWMTMFPIVHGNLAWGTHDYTGEYWIDDEDSCVRIGSAIVQEVSDDDTTEFFRISKGTLQKLLGYYIEAGLMAPDGEKSPFTEIAKKIARRHQFAEQEVPNFILRRGLTAISPPAEPDLDEEIPF